MQTFGTHPPPWLSALFATIDSGDGPGFGGYLIDDAVFRFGNAPVVRGRAAIERAVAEFFGSIRGCRHDIRRVWSADDAVALEGHVTYTRRDGTAVTLPFADTFVLAGDRIAEYSIYMDVAPLYAPRS